MHTETTPEQAQLLKKYAELLRLWNKKINLVAPGTLSELEARHITDSAQLVPHIPQGAQTVLDVGSGAGLPGLILAILMPGRQVTLVERDQRKSAFLRTAAHALQLANVQVRAEDIKNITEQYDVITCRAWADLKDILTFTAPRLAPNGCWLLLKGQAFDTELRACETMFHLTTERWPSIVKSKDGESGWVVKIRLQKAV